MTLKNKLTISSPKNKKTLVLATIQAPKIISCDPNSGSDRLNFIKKQHRISTYESRFEDIHVDSRCKSKTIFGINSLAKKNRKTWHTTLSLIPLSHWHYLIIRKGKEIKVYCSTEEDRINEGKPGGRQNYLEHTNKDKLISHLTISSVTTKKNPPNHDKSQFG